ncbi:hypothetical protein DKX38_003337 [Salix brachista]|uniref:Uncharacterized protein n=1 Tax=Salix brachista TaxID=2182728 RepID=A0A5N5NPW1_9ROSI|nr:hypothetical protein DKX38_003337 [Salix brachista]
MAAVGTEIASFHGKPTISKKLVEVLFKQASSSKTHIKVQRLLAKNTMLRPEKMSVDGKLATSVTITRTLSKLKAAGLDLVLSYLSFITLIVSFSAHHDLFLTLTFEHEMLLFCVLPIFVLRINNHCLTKMEYCFSPACNSLDILLQQEIAIMQFFSSALLEMFFSNLEAGI